MEKKQILENVLKRKNLKALNKKTFLEAWRTIFFLCPGLHPDDATNPDGGWPERLKPLAFEACRRFENGEFADNELHPYQEAMKGLKARRGTIQVKTVLMEEYKEE